MSDKPRPKLDDKMTATVSKRLFRSVRKEDFPDGAIVAGKAVSGILYPDLKPKKIERDDGSSFTRPADVKYFKDGTLREGGGTSLFNRSNAFGRKY